MKNKIVFLSLFLLFASNLTAQKVNIEIGSKISDGSIFGGKISSDSKSALKFAVMSDIHISPQAPSIEGTEKCVEDINQNPDLQFVIICGDIANFGSDQELGIAKNIFDKLNIPWFIIPGNHDATWSESGTNSFVKIFGYERFELEAGGIKFLGTPSGPNIRMAPALIPRESMLWLEERVGQTPEKQPIIFVNHYPLDTSLLKYNDVIDLLISRNTQLVISGHWHKNFPMDYEGIPGAIVRSSLKDAHRELGYNIVEIKGSLVSFSEKIVGKKNAEEPWYRVRMSNGTSFPDYIDYPYNTFNEEFPNVKVIWKYINNADIGCGAAIYSPKQSKILSNGEKRVVLHGTNLIPYLSSKVERNDIVIFADEAGIIKALNALDGSLLWEYKTDGKIFSTPAVYKDKVVVGSSDNFIYCLSVKDGKLKWKYECEKSVLGSANIYNGIVYIGASDGKFRALEIEKGELIWSYNDMKSFVVSRPYVDKEQVVIGDWGNSLYSFNPINGNLQWIWNTPRKVTNMSPAQVWPVKTNGRIIIVTPDRYSYQIDAKTGKGIARNYGGREAIGLSPDAKGYYVKSMKDTVKYISAYKFSKYPSSTASQNEEEREAEVIWTSIPGYNYEIGPTPITTNPKGGKMNKGLLFIATDKGNIFALNCLDGSLAFKYNISGALINYILPIGSNQLLVSTMDGVVALLEY